VDEALGRDRPNIRMPVADRKSPGSDQDVWHVTEERPCIDHDAFVENPIEYVDDVPLGCRLFQL